MDQIITYMEYRKDTSFRDLPFNEIDAFAFNCIAYLDFTWMGTRKIKFSDAAKTYITLCKQNSSDPLHDDEVKLLRLMGSGSRYKNVVIENPVRDINEEEEKTFYAITFNYTPFRSLVVFRGTDNSLVSWKENFTYAYKKPAAGQSQALKYVEDILANPFKLVRLSGHSKGGHLALYSAANLTPGQQKRIGKIYCFDAFSLPESLSDSDGYRAIEKKIIGFVPTACVIGNVFYPTYERRIVASDMKGFEQHNIIYWHVNASGFEYAEDTDNFSKDISKILNDWVYGVSTEQYEKVITEIFDMFAASHVNDFSDLSRLTPSELLTMVKSYIKVSKDTKDFMMMMIHCMTKNA